MFKKEMVSLTNKTLAGEMLRYDDLEHIYDDIIDDVNTNMNTCFPTLSEWEDFVDDWNEEHPDHLLDEDNYIAIPDKYLRKLAKYGGAYKFYTEDEEGESVALELYKGYQQVLFHMLRDYSEEVPLIFREHCQGSLEDIGGAFV